MCRRRASRRSRCAEERSSKGRCRRHGVAARKGPRERNTERQSRDTCAWLMPNMSPISCLFLYVPDESISIIFRARARRTMIGTFSGLTRLPSSSLAINIFRSATDRIINTVNDISRSNVVLYNFLFRISISIASHPLSKSVAGKLVNLDVRKCSKALTIKTLTQSATTCEQVDERIISCGVLSHKMPFLDTVITRGRNHNLLHPSLDSSDFTCVHLHEAEALLAQILQRCAYQVEFLVI